MRNYDAAIQAYQEYLDLDNERDLALWLQVFAYQEKGDKEGMRQNLEEIIQEKYMNYEEAEQLLKELFLIPIH